MGLKYKNSSGEWVQIPIPSEINDTMAGATSTYSSKKIEETYTKTVDLPVQDVQVNNQTVIDGSTKIAKITVPTKTSQLTNDNNFVSDKSYVHTDNNYTTDEKNKLAELNNYDDTEIKESIATKQDKLVSGVDIKTYNGESILTAGDIVQPITMLTENCNFDELPLGTRGMYLIANDNVIMQFNGQQYSTRRFYLYLFSYLSSTKKTLTLISAEGMVKRVVGDNISTAIRNAFINEEDYNENKIRTCYSDVKVDKLLENIRELPAVTTSDNDKILKVVDGVWTAVALANGDEVSY